MQKTELLDLKRILIFDYADVFYCDKVYLLKIKWKPYKNLTIAQYQDVFTKSLDFHEKNKVLYFLSDISEQGILSPEFRKWFQNEAMPKAISNGLKKAAVIFCGNVFKKYYLNNILDTTKKFGITFKFFGEEKEATEWLVN